MTNKALQNKEELNTRKLTSVYNDKMGILCYNSKMISK